MDPEDAFSDLAARLAGGLALLVAGYLLLSTAVVLLARSSRLCARLSRVLVPAALRLALTAAIGGTGPLALAASADAARPPVPDLDRPISQPASPLSPAAPRLTATAEPRAAADAAVVVRPGDSLWAIAARAAGLGASTAEVAADWPRWWTANRRLIGPDPDRLLPGQHLVPPPPRPRP